MAMFACPKSNILMVRVSLFLGGLGESGCVHGQYWELQLRANPHSPPNERL